jgi:valyl-tRNA synthetase
MDDFYPTDVLVTGYDILFFWVARMIMAGVRFTGQAPFSTVHLHGLVRVGGEKMSKTKGNVIDPLEAIEEFGADAVRFTLASAASSGSDGLRRALADGRLEALRHEALERGALHAGAARRGGRRRPRNAGSRAAVAPGSLDPLARRGGGDRRQPAPRRVPLRRGGGSDLRLLWHELCDHYLEMVKPVFAAPTRRRAAAARAVLRRCLADSLALLHPFMPFLTEEIWEKLTDRPGTLIVSPYPQGDPAARDQAAEDAIGPLTAIVTRVRKLRARAWAAPDGAAPRLTIRTGLAAARARAGARRPGPAADPPRAAVVPARRARAGGRVPGRRRGRRHRGRAARAPGGSGRADRGRRSPRCPTRSRRSRPSCRIRRTWRRPPAPVVEKARLRLRELEQKRAALATP